jgi:hypothetical protein
MKNNATRYQKYLSFKKSQRFVRLDTLKIMYNALIMPHFNYCSTVWQNNKQTHLDKLYKLQKRAANNIS